jgi:hypothetical protein
VVLLLVRTLVSWSLVIDERGAHEDLCDSDRRSVIPYVHRKIGLYCSRLPCLCEPEPFFIHVVHSPLEAVGYVIVSELYSQ